MFGGLKNSSIFVPNLKLIVMKKLSNMSYYTPIIGIYHYSKTFEPNGRIYGTKNVLFAFWMAFYHGGICLGAPFGLLLSLILK